MSEQGLLTGEEKAILVGKGLRLPPSKPLENECCGNGCVPCIFDWYDQKLLTWAKNVAMIWPEGRDLALRVLKSRGIGEDKLG